MFMRWPVAICPETPEFVSGPRECGVDLCIDSPDYFSSPGRLQCREYVDQLNSLGLNCHSDAADPIAPMACPYSCQLCNYDAIAWLPCQDDPARAVQVLTGQRCRDLVSAHECSVDLSLTYAVLDTGSFLRRFCPVSCHACPTDVCSPSLAPANSGYIASSESFLSPTQHLTSDTVTTCVFATGSGEGGTEERLGNTDTREECVALVESSRPSANGVTYGLDGTGNECYAEFNMHSRSGQDWQSCMFETHEQTVAAENRHPYPSNLDCALVLSAPPGKVVRVTVEHLDLDMQRDFLQVVDGSDPDAPLIHPTDRSTDVSKCCINSLNDIHSTKGGPAECSCGQSEGAATTSESLQFCGLTGHHSGLLDLVGTVRSMTIRFNTDCIGTSAAGFLLFYEYIDTAQPESCINELNLVPQLAILTTCEELSIAFGCSFDLNKIAMLSDQFPFPPGSSVSQLCASTCGCEDANNELPSPTSIWICDSPDDFPTKGSVLGSSTRGVPYMNGLDCEMVISAPPGHKVQIQLISISLESQFDFLSLFDGIDANAPQIWHEYSRENNMCCQSRGPCGSTSCGHTHGEPNPFFHKFCGLTGEFLEPPNSFSNTISTGTSITLRFNTDCSTNREDGFVLEYEFVAVDNQAQCLFGIDTPAADGMYTKTLSQELGPSKSLVFTVQTGQDARIGFFQNVYRKRSRFIGVPLPLQWDTARMYCGTKHYDLASAHSDGENNEIVAACEASLAAPVGPNEALVCAVGLANQAPSEPPRWTDGTPVDFENFAGVAAPVGPNNHAYVELDSSPLQVEAPKVTNSFAMKMGQTDSQVEVRIRGGGSRGLLQMNVGGTGWGAVCDDGFDANDNAAVAFCRSLGYSGLGAQHYQETHGDDEFAADDVQCPLGSSSIADCTSRAPHQDDCTDAETVGLDCAGDLIEHMTGAATVVHSFHPSPARNTNW